MKNLSWKAVLRKGCDKRLSATLKIKYKKTTYKVKIPDWDKVADDGTFDEQFADKLKTAFGEKKGEKIFKQVTKDFMNL